MREYQGVLGIPLRLMGLPEGTYILMLTHDSGIKPMRLRTFQAFFFFASGLLSHVGNPVYLRMYPAPVRYTHGVYK